MPRPRLPGIATATVAVLLASCSAPPEPTPLEELYGHLVSDGLVYFHADFDALSQSPALLTLVDQAGGEALTALQPELLAGVVDSTATQLVIRTASSYSGDLAALGSGHVERLADRLIRVELKLAEPLSGGNSPPAGVADDSAAIQLRFRPSDLYALADLAPDGFNLNFVAKTLDGAETASLTLEATDPVMLRLTLSAANIEAVTKLQSNLSKSIEFAESVTRATDPTNVWLSTIAGLTMRIDGTALQLVLSIPDAALASKSF